jgi:hypothetical protein
MSKFTLFYSFAEGLNIGHYVNINTKDIFICGTIVKIELETGHRIGKACQCFNIDISIKQCNTMPELIGEIMPVYMRTVD